MVKSNLESRILKKAIDLFFKHGFVKASIRDIVNALGVSNSAVYVYFKSKDEILLRIILEVGRELLEVLSRVNDECDDPIKCLGRMIYEQICFSMKEYKRTKIYIEEQYQLPGALKRIATKQHRRIYDFYYNKICEIDKAGLLWSGADKTVMTFSIFANMNWVYRWFRPNGYLSVEDIANQIVDISYKAILNVRVDELNRYEKSSTNDMIRFGKGD